MKRAVLFFFILCCGIFIKSQETDTSNVVPPAPSYPLDHKLPDPYEDVSADDAPKDIIGKMNLEKVVFKPDEPAEFPGGQAAFKQKVSQLIDPDELAGFIHRGIIYIIISDKGKITDLYIDSPSNNLKAEMKSVIGKIQTRWKPAKRKGMRVNSLFSLPVYFNIE